MGKAPVSAVAEVERCAWVCRYYAENAASILADEPVGSEAAGRAVGAKAGDQIKPSVLELGGSDPFLVMPSADLDAAVNAALTGRTINNGQSCIAAKRFVVHEKIYDDFAERFVARFEKLKVGDPMPESTDIGPLATDQIRAEIDEQVRKSVEAGATFVNSIVASDPRLPFGGVRRSGDGRELSGDGVLEFVHRKTIVVAS